MAVNSLRENPLTDPSGLNAYEAKVREATAYRIAKAHRDDPRTIRELERVAVNDPIKYVRDAANSALSTLGQPLELAQKNPADKLVEYNLAVVDPASKLGQEFRKRKRRMYLGFMLTALGVLAAGGMIIAMMELPGSIESTTRWVLLWILASGFWGALVAVLVSYIWASYITWCCPACEQHWTSWWEGPLLVVGLVGGVFVRGKDNYVDGRCALCGTRFEPPRKGW